MTTIVAQNIHKTQSQIHPKSSFQQKTQITATKSVWWLLVETSQLEHNKKRDNKPNQSQQLFLVHLWGLRVEFHNERKSKEIKNSLLVSSVVFAYIIKNCLNQIFYIFSSKLHLEFSECIHSVFYFLLPLSMI